MKLPIPKPNTGIVVSVVAGLAVFGLLLYAVRRAPSNALTSPIKKVTELAATK